jgi:hypothetical protein
LDLLRCKQLDAYPKSPAYYFFFGPITKTSSKESEALLFLWSYHLDTIRRGGNAENNFLSLDGLDAGAENELGAGEPEIFQANQRQRSGLVSDVDQSRAQEAFVRRMRIGFTPRCLVDPLQAFFAMPAIGFSPL